MAAAAYSNYFLCITNTLIYLQIDKQIPDIVGVGKNSFFPIEKMYVEPQTQYQSCAEDPVTKLAFDILAHFAQ